MSSRMSVPGGKPFYRSPWTWAALFVFLSWTYSVVSPPRPLSADVEARDAYLSRLAQWHLTLAEFTDAVVEESVLLGEAATRADAYGRRGDRRAGEAWLHDFAVERRGAMEALQARADGLAPPPPPPPALAGRTTEVMKHAAVRVDGVRAMVGGFRDRQAEAFEVLGRLVRGENGARSAWDGLALRMETDHLRAARAEAEAQAALRTNERAVVEGQRAHAALVAAMIVRNEAHAAELSGARANAAVGAIVADEMERLLDIAEAALKTFAIEQNISHEKWMEEMRGRPTDRAQQAHALRSEAVAWDRETVRVLRLQAAELRRTGSARTASAFEQDRLYASMLKSDELRQKAQVVIVG